MIHEIQPAQYLDEVSGPGITVVLLYLVDDLYREAHEEFEKVDLRVGTSQKIRLLECRVQSPEDCREVQACRFPQVRFFVRGNERHVHVGRATCEILMDLIHGLEKPALKYREDLVKKTID
jgi:hypothetical protein